MADRLAHRHLAVDFGFAVLPEQAGEREYLRFEDALRLANAMLFAEHQSVWLNTLLTISWSYRPEGAPTGPEDLQVQQSKLLERLQRAFRAAGLELRFAWVKEMAPKRASIGVHTHIFLHLRPDQFDSDLALLQASAGSHLNTRDCGLDIRHGKQRRPGFGTRIEMTRQLIYSIKGLDPRQRLRVPDQRLVAARDAIDLVGAAAAARMNPLGEPVPSPWNRWGVVAGSSRNLSSQVRMRSGWVELESATHVKEALALGYSPLNDLVCPPDPSSRRLVRTQLRPGP